LIFSLIKKVLVTDQFGPPLWTQYYRREE